MNNVLTVPPPEHEIVAKWRPERGNLVSICTLVYNHEPYLRDALHSILNQKTDFGFEILVHDDASQDASPSIIKEYAARYPRIVKPILQSVNQHSKGIYPSVHFNYPRADLPFVAICEGDDYWTDENKLQLQVEGLLARPEINLSFHTAVLVDHHDVEKPSRIYGDYGITDAIISFIDVLHRPRGWIPTASCMIRQVAKVRFLEFLKARSYLTVGDIYLQFFGGLPGGALYFAKPMSLYRYRTEQSWTRKTHLDPNFKAAHEIAMIRSYIELDQLTEKAYSNDFVALILQRLLWLFDPKAPSPSAAPDIALLKSIHAACEIEIEKTLNKLERSDTRYVIFGCASGCERILKTLSTGKVAAIVDRDNRRVGENISGRPIIGTHELGTYSDCELIVSTVTSDRNAIKQLVKSTALQNERVRYLFDSALDFVDSRLSQLQVLSS